MQTIKITELDSGYCLESGTEQHGFSTGKELMTKIISMLGLEFEVRKHAVKDRQEIYGILNHDSRGVLFPVKKQEFLVPEMVALPGNPNVLFAETYDKRILIKYSGAEVHTTWKEIQELITLSGDSSELKWVPKTISKHKRTAIRQFMIAVKEGLKPHDSETLDPDKEFRKILNRTTQPEYETGTQMVAEM